MVREEPEQHAGCPSTVLPIAIPSLNHARAPVLYCAT
jgi:hypothetical protein